MDIHNPLRYLLMNAVIKQHLVSANLASILKTFKPVHRTSNKKRLSLTKLTTALFHVKHFSALSFFTLSRI